MVNARYQGTTRLFYNRLPPEISDRIARTIHAARVAQTTARRQAATRELIRTGPQRWLQRARNRIAARESARDRVTIARIALTRRQLRNRGIIGPRWFNAYFDQ